MGFAYTYQNSSGDTVSISWADAMAVCDAVDKDAFADEICRMLENPKDFSAPPFKKARQLIEQGSCTTQDLLDCVFANWYEWPWSRSRKEAFHKGVEVFVEEFAPKAAI